MPLSRLPFGILYRVSDVMFYLFYYVVRYRRKVVVEGLTNSFPEKSPAEIEALSRKFFRHLCDLIFESFKGFSMSKDEIVKRHRYTNIELLEKYYAQGKSISIVGAHVANWEWVALSLPLATSFKTYGIYQTLTNPFMNRVVKKNRERSGMRLVSKEEVVPTLRSTRDQKIAMGYIGDQSPSRHGRHYWLKFLGQDTAAMSGYEAFAKEYDTPVIYLSVEKKRRGFYECTFYLVSEEPRKEADGQIVETYMKILEGIVRKQPEFWLWSHRRWKIKKPVT